MQNVQSSLCKKESALRALNNHLQCGTTPRSLNWTPSVQVKEEFQQQLNEKVHEAVQHCQQKIISALIEARSREAESLRKDLSDIKSDWTEQVRTTLQHMHEQQILACNMDEVMNLCSSDFNRRSSSRLEDVRVNYFLREKKKTDKFTEKKAQEAEARFNESLQPPEISCLQQQVQALEQRLSHMMNASKNSTAKPMKTKTASKAGIGWGGNKSANHQGGKTPKSQRRNGKPNAGQNGSDQGKRALRSASKSSTKELGLGQKNFRRRPKQC